MPSRDRAARKTPFAGITDDEDGAVEIARDDPGDLPERFEVRGREPDNCQIAAMPLG